MWTETARSRALTERITVACADCGAEVVVTMIRRGQRNLCPACKRAIHTAESKARYHALRAQGMTPAEWKKPKTNGPLSSPGQHQSRKPTITIIYDPCEWPMAVGAAISQEELAAGLRLGSFVAGTVFRLADGRTMTVGGEQVTP